MHFLPLQLADGTALGRVWVATRRKDRMRGLLGREGLPVGELMLLEPCGSIHTIGMRFAIDVLFLDRNWRVIAIRESVHPGRLAWGGWRACRTLEAAAGWLDLERLRGARFAPPGEVSGPEGVSAQQSAKLR